MGQGARIAAALTATIVLMGMAAPALSLEIDQVLGRWSTLDRDDCQYADDSEGAPLHIRRVESEIWIGNYGWLCSVAEADWKKDGDFLVASAKDCGMEGGDDTFDENFVLGLNAKDELLMAKDATGGYRRCPAAAE